MKTIRSLAIAFVIASSSMLSAGVMTSCPPAQSTIINNASSTPQVFTCDVAPGVSAIRYQMSLSFQDNSSAGPDLSVLGVATNNAGLPSVQCLAVGATTATDQTLGACVVMSDWIDATGLSQFLVTVTGGPGSDPLPFNSSASVKYEAVPEPSTLHMAGLLLAFGLYRSAKR
jgi:hypothetical protein